MLMSFLAMMLYALETSITEWKLTNLSPRLLTLMYSVGVALFSLVTLILARETHSLPDAKQSIFVILMVLTSFLAANAHFQALTSGTSAVVLSMFYALMPVFSSIFMAIFKHQMPSLQLFLAWILATSALFLVSTTK